MTVAITPFLAIDFLAISTYFLPVRGYCIHNIISSLTLINPYSKNTLVLKQGRCSNNMITSDSLRACNNCGNVFLKKIGENMTNRCPACNVWKKELSN